MSASTGSGGATPEQSNSRQGASAPCSDEHYEASSIRSTGGRPSWPGDSRAADSLNRPELKRGGSALKGVRESNIVRLEPAGREEQLKRWGLNPSARWSEAERRPRHSDELDGHDYDADAVDGTDRELEELGFLLDGGWTAVDSTRGTARNTGFTPGARDAGMTAHRGVLHPDEHVDDDALRAALEDELGFNVDDVHAVFRQGKKSAAQLELRARIDARLLELAEAGGNLTLLGRALGFPVKSNGNVRVLENALARARQERSATS